MNSAIRRQVFATPRLLDFFTVKDLSAQIGHGPELWPLVALKELIDNALDACEEAGITPEIAVEMTDKSITVRDNGLGMNADTVKRILDYSVRVSSRDVYISPSRGAQGNALKTLVAMPFALSGKRGRVDIDSKGTHHTIDVTVDMLRQVPVISHQVSSGLIKNGTSVKLFLPRLPFEAMRFTECRFLQIAGCYNHFNPHLTLIADLFGRRTEYHRSTDAFQKWRPSDPAPPHWYTPEQLKRLILSYIVSDDEQGTSRTVREFISEFRGLTSTGKQKQVLDALSLSRCPLTALLDNGQPNDELITALLYAMCNASAQIKPKQLGVIGRDHLTNQLFGMEGFKYYATDGMGDGLPYVLELAFGASPDLNERIVASGINFTPALDNVFRGSELDAMLGENHAGRDSPVMFIAHLTCPHLTYSDRGKSNVILPAPIIDALNDGVNVVTKDWAKQMRAEYRDAARRARRFEALDKSIKVSAKNAAYRVMEAAYLKASGNGQYPANARQIMYAARGEIQRITGKPLDDKYFTQVLLPDFMNENPDLTKGWDVAYDARGHFAEPHTGRSLGVGTLEAKHYLATAKNFKHADNFTADSMLVRAKNFPTYGPEHRYNGVLFIEKEGFMPLLERIRLAKKYDLAIMSTKGMSVIASRLLVDYLCGKLQLPLFIVRDFDSYGFSIARTIQETSRRYVFDNSVNAIDLGLRLDDVKAYHLEPERVVYPRGTNPTNNLELSGATQEEIDFLWHGNGTGDRVELNAMTSEQFTKWITEKLDAQNIRKVIPHDASILEAAYRQEYRRKLFNKYAAEAAQRAAKEAENIAVPTTLRQQIMDSIDNDPTLPWDDAIAVTL